MDVILMDGFLGDRDKFHAEAKNCRCGCRDYFLGGVVMKLLVSEMGNIYLRGGFAQHMTCIQMGGDGEVWNKSIILVGLPHRTDSYLHEFVGFVAFFPSNETFRPPFFFFPLPFAVSLPLAPRLGETTDFGMDFFFLLATGLSLFLRIPGGVFFAPLPLDFYGDLLPWTAFS